MPSVHRYPPIQFRPPKEDRARLLALAEQSGRPVNAILAEALRRYLADSAGDLTPGSLPAAPGPP